MQQLSTALSHGYIGKVLNCSIGWLLCPQQGGKEEDEGFLVIIIVAKHQGNDSEESNLFHFKLDIPLRKEEVQFVVYSRRRRME